MLDVPELARRAALAVAAESSQMHLNECRALEKYALETKWHHWARGEALAVAAVFTAVIARCEKDILKSSKPVGDKRGQENRPGTG